MIPALLFFLAIVGFYPVIQEAAVPAIFMLNKLQITWLTLSLQIVLFGTFIETGAGLLHSFNERLAASFRDSGKPFPAIARPLFAVGLLIVSVFPATYVGLVNLISNGYGILTYAFMAVFVLPVMTVGVYRAFRRPKAADPPSSGSR